MRTVDWYFDYVSPYPYLQLARFAELPRDVAVQPRPVLFAALLNHWGQKGPAEIPAKRRQTALYTRWLAHQRDLAFAGPPRHPFNPLALLRLTLAAGASVEAVRIVYTHVWGEGRDGQEMDSIRDLAAKLGISDLDAAIGDPEVKEELRANTTAAIDRGVYGVPTFAVDDQLFWGDDVTDLFLAYLADPNLFEKPPFDDVQDVPSAAERTFPR